MESTEQSVALIEKPKDPPREKMINTAVAFLKLPQVQANSLKSKQEFLRSKGLTDEEVRIACEIAGAFDQVGTINQIPPVGISNSYALVKSYPQIRSPWIILRDMANVAAILVGIYFISKEIYQRYLYKYFTKDKKDRKSANDIAAELRHEVSDKLLFVQEKLSNLDTKISKLVVNQESQDLENQVNNKQIDDLKLEVLSLKGLLLNRKQFPNPTISLLPGTPSIPSWQLKSESSKSAEHQDSIDSTESNKHTPENSEGSEPELISKDNGSNGSDSSLEIVNK